ncbi:MAG: hypothetical protein M3271_02310 [Actinomycetota bacterium]|nr:hypothetical protein [Actinomycetota bacterium]
MNRITAALVAGVVALALVAPASAGDGPPATNLRHRGRAIQKGALGSYCWSYPAGSDGTAATKCADGTWYFPRAAMAAPGGFRIRIRKRARPTEWGIWAYRRVRRGEGWVEPVGPATRIPHRLRRFEVDGRTVAWDAIFRLREDDRHYYISASGEWDQGDAHYTFHVRT